MAKPLTLPGMAIRVLRVLQSANGGIVTDRMIKAAVWPGASPPMDLEPYASYIKRHLGHEVVRRRNTGYQLLDLSLCHISRAAAQATS